MSTATVVDERGRVESVLLLDGGIIELTLHAPHLAAAAAPGQFAQVRCGAGPVPLLRRPFSVAWVEGDRCGFIFEAVGEGTRRLAASHPGDSIDLLGPLGTGFDLGGASAVVALAGGLGCAPFPFLAARARAAGLPVTVLHGAATAVRLYPAERFQRGDASIAVVEATDDGTRGHAGRVTELLAACRLDGALVAACGPNPMLAATAAALPGRRLEVSLEAPMGCGIGTCLGCALPRQGGGWLLCCTDGPVVDAGLVDWPALAELPAAHVA